RGGVTLAPRPQCGLPRLRQADPGLMRCTDLANDGQAQTGTAALVTAPVEALEDLLVLGFGNARAIVLDLQHGRCQSADDQIASGRSMRQRVVQQIVQQLVEQCRLTVYPYRLISLKRQRDATGMSQRRHGQTQFASQLAEVDALRSTFGNGPRPALDTCQGKQLIGQRSQA